MYIQVFIKAKFAIKSLSRDYSDFYFGSLGFDSSLTPWLSYIRYYTVSSVIAEIYYLKIGYDHFLTSRFVTLTVVILGSGR